ncbi:MAG: cupin domain-containing protein [Rhizobiaceae bacterium]
MIESLKYIAQTPDFADVDALSEVLGSVRFTGGHVEAHSSRLPGAQAFSSGDRSLLIVRTGTLRLACQEAGADPIELHEGDVVLLAFGSSFSISYPAVVAETHLPTDGENQSGDPAGGKCEWLRGTFDVDARLSERLLVCLPKVMVLRQVRRDAMGWLEIASQFALAEIEAREPGAAVMISRIVELLFIRLLRLWAVDPRAQASWLVGATDPAIGRALGVMHARPDRGWSVAELARIAGLSRSVFAAHFVRLVGHPPLRYLIGLRLDKATELLRTTDKTIVEVAIAVGYDSEAAFSRAFKLRFGRSPSRWRRQ